MKRIILHWTAGANTPSDLDRRHYHFLIDGEGKVVAGDHLPEANRSTSDGVYAAHTRRLNTGSIGVAVCGMAGAVERPFSVGTRPIRDRQIEALAELVADLCETYGISVGRKTVLTHAEVQPTLGVAQRGKWDITWLPGMEGPGDPIQVGDYLRQRVREAMGAPVPSSVAKAAGNRNVQASGVLGGAAALLPGLGWISDMEWQQMAVLGGFALVTLIVAGVIFREELAWMRQGEPEAE